MKNFLKYIIVPSLLLAGTVQAQHSNELNIEGASLYIASGANVYVRGDVRLDGATGLLDNDGRLEVQGHFYGENPAVSQLGSTGTVHFNNANVNGTEEQQIVCLNSTHLTGNAAFYNVELQNRSTTGLVYLNGGNVEVKNTLQYLTGAVKNRIRTATAEGLDGAAYSNYLYMSNTATDNFGGTAGAAGDATGYVDGRLRLRCLNNAAYNFQIGLNNTRTVIDAAEANQLATITFGASSISSADAVMEASFTRNTGGTTSSPPTMCANNQTVSCIANHGFWNIDVISGTLAAGANYNAVVNPRNEMSNCGGPVWVLVKRANGGAFADWTSSYTNGQLDGSVCTTGNYSTSFLSIPRTGFDSFSDFGLGSVGGALPIELLSLEARPVNNKFIQVYWSTEVEENTKGFEVLRSTDARNFQYIGFVNATGSNSSYIYDDYNVDKGVTYYYRLKSVDNDGSTELSDVVSAALVKGTEIDVVSMSPNPTNDETVITINAIKENDVVLRSYNAIGQLMMNDVRTLNIGFNNLTVDTKSWAAGTYMIQISTNNGNGITRKLVVTK